MLAAEDKFRLSSVIRQITMFLVRGAAMGLSLHRLESLDRYSGTGCTG